MTSQQLTILGELLPILSASRAQALQDLLAQVGVDSEKLLDILAQPKPTAQVLAQSFVEQAGLALEPTTEVKASGKALLAELSPEPEPETPAPVPDLVEPKKSPAPVPVKVSHTVVKKK